MTAASGWRSALRKAWATNLGRSLRSDPVWVELLYDLTPGSLLSPDFMGSPLSGPPRVSEWDFTGGDESRAVPQANDLEAALREYGWLGADLEAAATLTALRGCDLAHAWVQVTNGRNLGGLASLSLARALFEAGLEAFRVAAVLHRSLAEAPTTSGHKVRVGDGIWVPLFRYVGGEKTAVVTQRENTRNVLANLKWLRSADSTRVLADDYDLVSELLHAGGNEVRATTSRLPGQSELALVVTGASTSIQAYQHFRMASRVVRDLADHAKVNSDASGVVVIGHDPNIPKLQTVPPR